MFQTIQAGLFKCIVFVISALLNFQTLNCTAPACCGKFCGDLLLDIFNHDDVDSIIGAMANSFFSFLRSTSCI